MDFLLFVALGFLLGQVLIRTVGLARAIVFTFGASLGLAVAYLAHLFLGIPNG